MKRSVQSIAREFGPFGIRANTVSPGCIAINPKGYEDKTYEGDADRIPIGRTGTGEDIGYMAAFLCSEEAGFITGADFLVDVDRHAEKILWMRQKITTVFMEEELIL